MKCQSKMNSNTDNSDKRSVLNNDLQTILLFRGRNMDKDAL